MTEYVLIYDNSGVFDASRDDLKTLFESYGIYSDVTVRFTDFKSNFDGLPAKQTTVVLPGGMVSAMEISLRGERPKLQQLFSEGSKGLFICAGAYLAVNNADIYMENSYRYGYNLSSDRTLNILSDYKAIGSFIPNEAIPRLATLSLRNDCGYNLRQIYLGGSGFKEIEKKVDQTCEVVATYTDCRQYTFFKRPLGIFEVQTNMPAILRDKQRGLFLSGPHIEACVEGSKVLKTVQEETDKEGEILPHSINFELEFSRGTIIPLLKDTLTGVSP
jgi:glutamine amidotransferase-like uncharacterized protein